MAQSPDDSRDNAQAQRRVSWRSPEVLGELILLGIIAVLAIVFVNDLTHRIEGRWLPFITVAIATPLWFIRLYTVLSRRKAIEQGMIMDLGFRLGEDPEGEKRRAALYFGTIVVLVILVWLIGFHIGLPLWVFAYLLFWTRAKWYYGLLAGLGFEAFIVGILDLTLDIFWFEPLFFRWIGVAYPFSEMFTRIF
ncbi:MAG: hypothetical protein OXL97_01865 [Chloroflexota bacterium]|nr:hypothetical protein [Chloroflexota bacterium]MDE2886460.1 hypothetical protein [Chloroflexota bacterium]